MKRAEIRLGEMLAATERAKGTKGSFKGKDISGSYLALPPEDDTPTLAELGITKRESSMRSISIQPIFKLASRFSKSSIPNLLGSSCSFSSALKSFSSTSCTRSGFHPNILFTRS